MNSFSTSFKAFALVALLSVVNVNAMEDKDISLANTPTATPTTNAATIVSPTPNVPTKVEAPKQEIPNLVKAEGNSPAAVQDNTSAAANPSSTPPAANSSTEPKVKVTDAAKQSAIWKALVAPFNALNDMRTRGWSKWSFNEKAGVVVGAVAILAAVYVGYKIYESSANSSKSKVKKAATRA
jgi:hypothetical protein